MGPKRLCVFVFSIAFFLNLYSAQAALKDGTNFAMRPDSLKCISAVLPDDFGPVGAPTTFEVRSDCGEWCDFTSSTVFTDPSNPASIPICINTFGKEVNQTKKLRFTIDARNKQKEFNYGICVADQEDQDSGQGNPCTIVSLSQKYFEISMEPITYVDPGVPSEFEIQIYSALKLDIDVTVQETGKTFTIQTNPQEKVVLKDKITTSTDTLLNVKASVKDCSLPSCTKTASTLISTKRPPEYAISSGNFSISLMPEAASTKRGQLVKYYLEIKNYGEEKDYTVSLLLPKGLKSSFNASTKTILNRENFVIDVTPEGTECLYTFRVSVKGQVTKDLQGSISVNEASCDLNRLKATESLDPGTLNNINSAILRAKDSTLADDIKVFSDLSSRPANQTVVEVTEAKKPAKKTEGGGIDFITIVAVVAVVALAALFLIFKKGRKVEAQEEGDWSGGGKY